MFAMEWVIFGSCMGRFSATRFISAPHKETITLTAYRRSREEILQKRYRPAVVAEDWRIAELMEFATLCSYNSPMSF